MRIRLQVFLRIAIFWLAYFFLCRIVFLVYEKGNGHSVSVAEFFKTIAHGARMDFSTAGYFVMFSGLMLFLSTLLLTSELAKLTGWVNYALIVLCSTIVVVDLELYVHWGFRLNTTPFMYISPEAFESAQPGVIVKLCIIFISLTGISLVIFSRVVVRKLAHLHTPYRKKESLLLLLLAGLMFIPIRGSFGVAPMNTGVAYYSKTNQFANHAGINVVWNFMYSLQRGSRTLYPENLLPRPKADRLFAAMQDSGDSTQSLLTTRRPNIILIIMESFTADVIEPLGGLPGIAPNLDSLCTQGVLFSNFYASGDRTDKGLISVLSGYPAQPQTSIIKFPAKTQSLPKLVRRFNQLGYRTSFDYGGSADFANMRSYLTLSGFDHLTSEDQFPAELNTAKWGVRDEHLFKQVETEIDTATHPFFKCILTLSSHEPFDVPALLPIDPKNEESLFLNAIHYSDKQIGAFINWLRAQKVWNSTLVILVADHGHRYPGNKALRVKERFHIPMLWLGGAIKKDTTLSTIGSQTDIASTLLHQLGEPAPEFTFSRNLLGEHASSFAQYFFNDGYGYVDTTRYIIYDNPGSQYLQTTGVNQDADLNFAKAYAQHLYTDYNAR